MSALYTILAILLGIVCVFMILLILVQKGRGGGLSGAFGGAGGNTAFGTKTGDLLTWVTAAVFGMFLLLTMGLTWTGDELNRRYNATEPDLIADDASEDDPLLDADGDGEVDLIPPSDDQSSMPMPPPVVEPGIKPSADDLPPEAEIED